VAAALLLAGLKPCATVIAQQQAQTPLQRLEASILRTTRSVNATWGIYVKSLDSGEEIAVDADHAEPGFAELVGGVLAAGAQAQAMVTMNAVLPTRLNDAIGARLLGLRYPTRSKAISSHAG